MTNAATCIERLKPCISGLQGWILLADSTNLGIDAKGIRDTAFISINNHYLSAVSALTDYVKSNQVDWPFKTMPDEPIFSYMGQPVVQMDTYCIQRAVDSLEADLSYLHTRLLPGEKASFDCLIEKELESMKYWSDFILTSEENPNGYSLRAVLMKTLDRHYRAAVDLLSDYVRKQNQEWPFKSQPNPTSLRELRDGSREHDIKLATQVVSDLESDLSLLQSFSR